MHAAVIIIALLTMGEDRSVLAESVDVVELNHFYDDDGRHVFDQVLFYRWEHGRHQVVDWRLVKSPHHMPYRVREHWECLWFDKDGTLRRVLASSYRETWTQYDPELVEREVLPKERRQLLRKQ